MYVRSESFSYLSSSHYSTLVGQTAVTVANIEEATQKIHWGEVSDIKLPLSFTLLHLVYAASNRKDDTIAVGGASGVSGDIESAIDESMCGWDDLPCRSVPE